MVPSWGSESHHGAWQGGDGGGGGRNPREIWKVESPAHAKCLGVGVWKGEERKGGCFLSLDRTPLEGSAERTAF